MAKLTPDDGAAGDRFGETVYIFEETVIVGAPGHDSAGADAGAAYVFVNSGGVWSQEQKLLPTTSLPGDEFGRSVALSDETAVVGSPRNGVGAASATGSAYIFVRSGTVWTEEAELAATGGVLGNQFGVSVAVESDTVVVGALLETGAVARTGAGFVFDRVATVWSETIKLADANGNKNDYFGISVSIHLSVICVGASGDDDNGNGSGSVFDYFNGPEGWNEVDQYSGAGASDLFGASVSRSYRSTLVGVRLDDDGVTNAGSAQIFVDFGTFTAFEVYVASDAATQDRLGASVSASGCYLASGAPGNDELALNAGAAYVYIIQHPDATLVNGTGVNPVCMTTVEAPVVGEHWRVEIDTTAFPTAGYTQILAYNKLNPLPFIRPIGEILVSRSSGLVWSSLIPGAGVIEHEFIIPNDPYLVGITFAGQGVVRSGTGALPILGLCNAELVTVGCTSESHH